MLLRIPLVKQGIHTRHHYMYTLFSVWQEPAVSGRFKAYASIPQVGQVEK